MSLNIRYTLSGSVSIAYTVLGDGEIDLVFVPHAVSNLVFDWDSAHWRAFYERLARTFRLIVFDKRGTGLSDLGGQFPTLETRMDDVGAVLDAAGSSNAVLFGSHDGCSMAALYAATYPERARALVLFHPMVHNPDGQSDTARVELGRLRHNWGTQEYGDLLLRENNPSLLEDPEEREWFTNYLRVGASPTVAYEIYRAWYETDIREVLPAVQAPTLVLYRRSFYESTSLDVAAQIPNASAVRVSGTENSLVFLSPEIPEEIERFVAGEARSEVLNTVLATVLFTDIVDSTKRAAELGDHAWRELLEQHHALVRRELARYRGEEKDTAGDGFFATFDGPARAIRCAQAIVDGVGELGVVVRAGVHTGECELHEGKVAGIAVVTGARIAAAAGGGEVLVSHTVTDLVAGSGLEFVERCEVELKGVPGTWRLYAVAEASEPSSAFRS